MLVLWGHPKPSGYEVDFDLAESQVLLSDIKKRAESLKEHTKNMVPREIELYNPDPNTNKSLQELVPTSLANETKGVGSIAFKAYSAVYVTLDTLSKELLQAIPNMLNLTTSVIYFKRSAAANSAELLKASNFLPVEKSAAARDVGDATKPNLPSTQKFRGVKSFSSDLLAKARQGDPGENDSGSDWESDSDDNSVPSLLDYKMYRYERPKLTRKTKADTPKKTAAVIAVDESFVSLDSDSEFLSLEKVIENKYQFKSNRFGHYQTVEYISASNDQIKHLNSKGARSQQRINAAIDLLRPGLQSTNKHVSITQIFEKALEKGNQNVAELNKLLRLLPQYTSNTEPFGKLVLPVEVANIATHVHIVNYEEAVKRPAMTSFYAVANPEFKSAGQTKLDKKELKNKYTTIIRNFTESKNEAKAADYKKRVASLEDELKKLENTKMWNEKGQSNGETVTFTRPAAKLSTDTFVSFA